MSQLSRRSKQVLGACLLMVVVCTYLLTYNREIIENIDNEERAIVTRKLDVVQSKAPLKKLTTITKQTLEEINEVKRDIAFKKVQPIKTSFSEIRPSKKGSKTSSVKQNSWLEIGTGLNFHSYSQTISGTTDVKYENISTGTIYVGTGAIINEPHGMDFTFKRTPGEVKSSDTITVTNGVYWWDTYGAEYLYRPSEWEWRLGVQYHKIPFMYSNAGEIEVRYNSMTMMTFGFNYELYRDLPTSFIVGMRYQYPLATSSTEGHRFDIEPNFAFDGQIGFKTKLTSHFYYGVMWYGQWHDYAFEYKDSTTNQVSNGDQAIFYSTFDLRLGYSF